jgi:hypothetical protein
MHAISTGESFQEVANDIREPAAATTASCNSYYADAKISEIQAKVNDAVSAIQQALGEVNPDAIARLVENAMTTARDTLSSDIAKTRQQIAPCSRLR